eukprot:13338429-Alexandrium_andersonii.AAC.1
MYELRDRIRTRNKQPHQKRRARSRWAPDEVAQLAVRHLDLVVVDHGRHALDRELLLACEPAAQAACPKDTARRQAAHLVDLDAPEAERLGEVHDLLDAVGDDVARGLVKGIVEEDYVLLAGAEGLVELVVLVLLLQGVVARVAPP